MTHAFADACLDALAAAVGEERWSRLLHTQAKRLIAEPDAVAAVARTVAVGGEGERAEDAAALLCAVLDEARMAQENWGKGTRSYRPLMTFSRNWINKAR